MDKTIENMTIDEIRDFINNNYSDQILVNVSDYESESKETYKFLYETTFKELNKLREDLFNVQMDKENAERELSEVQAQLDSTKSVNDELNSGNKDLITFIEKYVNTENIVSDVKIYDTEGNRIEIDRLDISSPEELSDYPGVYGFKRPSWFSPLQKELDRKNIAEKNVRNTRSILSDRLHFLKKLLSKDPIKKLADEHDKERRDKIAGILLGSGSNEEKYIKYILVTPGLSKEYQEILFNASSLGLDANIIIELLEQPKESFNKEIIETFVTEVHRGTEYNLKQELAEELVKGDWYITASVNGITKKLQLAPIDEINEIKDYLENIKNALSGNADINDTNIVGTGDSVIEPEPPVQDIPDEEKFPFIYEDMPSDSELSPMINFDESML